MMIASHPFVCPFPFLSHVAAVHKTITLVTAIIVDANKFES
jgi:alkanesulfonate monooxygenase SsuD/methylene tetrahydromethanopterin reductase-like flavin-dependent oxidoreductase (luciferase family)